MKISLIVVMDQNRGIGKDNKIPWRLKTDIRRFKELTMGHHLIIGRKTFQSIGKPLPGRVNIILTMNPSFLAEGCQVVHTLDQALGIALDNGERETFIIGGAEIYTQSLSIANRIYLTLVHTESEADVYFPNLDESEWFLTSSMYFPSDEDNDYPTTFKILEKYSKESPSGSDSNCCYTPHSP